WMHWTPPTDPGLFSFVQRLARIRSTYAVFRRHDFFDGSIHAGRGLRDIYWLAPEGREVGEDDWRTPERKTIGCQFGNDDASEPRFLMILNADAAAIGFRLSADFPSGPCHPLLDSGTVDGEPVDETPFRPGTVRRIPGRCFLLFRSRE